MNLHDIVLVTQALVSLLLVACILIQHRASGLSATFGGQGAVVVQRRGAEKAIYKLTIILSILFFGFSIALWFVQ